MGLAKRKSAYVEYAQAVPLKYAIDDQTCIYFVKNGKCGACKKLCPTDAVDFDQKATTETLKVGSVVLSPGFEPFDPSGFDNYQYAKLPNVVTSMEFERMLSASGPSMGHVTRPSDGKDPKKIAWFQCIGSRDINRCDNAHCSSVCCMYAIKEAVIAKEHDSELECTIFFMDMRTHGKEFERFYENARDKVGVRFERSRIHTIDPVGDSGDLQARYVSESGELQTEVFDMVVLSIGLQTSPETVALAEKLGIELTGGNFCKAPTFEPVTTNRSGIFASGAFQGPKDILQAIIEASAAATAAGEILADARGTEITPAEWSRKPMFPEIVLASASLCVAAEPTSPASWMYRPWPNTPPHCRMSITLPTTSIPVPRTPRKRWPKSSRKKTSTGWSWRPVRLKPTKRCSWRP